MPKPEKDLNTLGRLVDNALQAAVQMDERTTIYLLSMASRDVMEKIEAANRTTTVPSDDAE
jgi:sensor histidine kinase regulating citrate/malate metabolism